MAVLSLVVSATGAMPAPAAGDVPVAETAHCASALDDQGIAGALLAESCPQPRSSELPCCGNSGNGVSDFVSETVELPYTFELARPTARTCRHLHSGPAPPVPSRPPIR